MWITDLSFVWGVSVLVNDNGNRQTGRSGAEGDSPSLNCLSQKFWEKFVRDAAQCAIEIWMHGPLQQA